MCRLQNYCFLSVILVTFIQAINGQCAEDCSIFMRCDPYVNDSPVWTVVDGRCKGYKSSCLFAYDNCKRVSQCLSAMIETTHQQCEQFCPSNCDCVSEAISPLCGTHPYRDASNQRAENLMEFKNQCYMDQFACQNSKPFLYKNDGSC